jgi:hypothetical protein
MHMNWSPPSAIYRRRPGLRPLSGLLESQGRGRLLPGQYGYGGSHPGRHRRLLHLAFDVLIAVRPGVGVMDDDIVVNQSDTIIAQTSVDLAKAFFSGSASASRKVSSMAAPTTPCRSNVTSPALTATRSRTSVAAVRAGFC